MAIFTKTDNSWYSDDNGDLSRMVGFDSFYTNLEKCLVSGGANKTISNIEIIETDDGDIIQMTSTAHGFQSYQVVIISGADQEVWNGRRKIVVIDENTFYYYLENAELPNPTGTILARMAPIGGWELTNYTSNTTFILRSVNPHSYGHCIRFNRVDNHYSSIRMYFTLSDAIAQSSPRSDEFAFPHYNTNDPRCIFELFGDPLFLCMIIGEKALGHAHCFCFGQFISLFDYDPTNTLLVCRTNTSIANLTSATIATWGNPYCNFFEQATTGSIVISNRDQTANFQACSSRHFRGGTLGASFDGYLGAFFTAGYCYIHDSYSGVRGIMPGIVVPGVHPVSNGLLRGNFLWSDDKVYRIMNLFRCNASTASNFASFIIDVIGPWR